jgi:hypothetical protein
VAPGKPPMGKSPAMGFWVCQFALYVCAVRAAWGVYAIGL